MITAQNANAAYKASSTIVKSERSVEYDAFSSVTADLQKHRSHNRFLIEALDRNRRLWTILAADVADTENALPAPLKAQIFYLAEFVSHHTRKVLRSEADATPIIDINVAVMRGLSQRRAS